MLRELVKKYKKTTIALFACVVFFVAEAALAQPNLGINSLAEGGVQLAQTDIRIIIARIVQVFLGLLGMIAVILIIYAGWLWMSAAGDAQKIAAAKKTLFNAVIGLAIILSSVAITQFIIGAITGAALGGGTDGGATSYGQPFSGSLGAGIIESHAPERGAIVFRNTKIAVTFKEPIDEKTLILDTNKDGIFGNDSDEVNFKGFKMTRTSILKQNNNNFKNVSNNDLVSAIVKFTPDKKSFVFAPKNLLGDSASAVSYTVFLTTNIKKADGANAFTGSFGDGYQWEFQVDPIIDNIPPKLLNVIPEKGLNPRNTIVQLNFSEGIDPTSASGEALSGGGGFQNIALASAAAVLGGTYKIANGYQTVEFTTKDLCGTNSCGGNIYCLPALSLISGLVKAATLGAEPPQALGFPYDGIVDLAGNSFDGTGDNIAAGPAAQSGKPPYNWVGGDTATQGDDAAWKFNTTDKIDLVPPKIMKIEPGISAQNVGLEAPIQIIWSKLMSVATLNNSNLAITHDVPPPYEMWFDIYSEALDANDAPVLKGGEPVKTKSILKHGSFAPSVSGGIQYNYFPSAISKVQDLRQNCYNPSSGPSCTPTAALPYCCNGTPGAVKCSYLPSAYGGSTLPQNNPALPPAPPAPPGGGETERAFYVSPGGDNAAAGTIEEPWRTIQSAAEKLVAGDTVYIRKGIYKERVMPKNSGTDGKYIIYAAYPGEEVILDGANIQLPNDQAGLFEINSKSHIKVLGLKIKNAMTDENSNGIFVEKSENIIIEKNYTHNTRSSGIGVWSSKNIIIDGNEVVKANMGPSQESITVAGTDTFEIKNNSVHDTGPNKEGIDAKDGSRNGKIFKNIVYNVPALGIYVEAWDKHTYNIGVYQNIIYNITDGDGIDLASEMGGLLEDIRVNNNIIYNNNKVGIMVGWNGTAENQPIKNVKIINNTIYNNGRDWGGCISADNKDAEEIVIRNNICSSNHSFEIAIGRTPKENVTVENNLLYSYKADTDDGEIPGKNFIDADPLFVNVGAADFHLQAGSPAINKGFITDAPAFDFDGRARPQGGGYDIGAFEHI